jgi:quaternary ammonium compound-resistance protein SugE
MKNPTTLAWAVLFLAGIFETAWAIGLKYTEGFTKPLAGIITIILIIISMALLAWSVKFLPVGTAYAVWTGIGAVGTAVAGVILFKEPIGAFRFFFIFLIISGILGLYLISGKSNS